MAKKKLHTAEEQRAAMDKIEGFVYQFYYFLYLLLTNKEGTVSFIMYPIFENAKICN